jgi:hypothetical protein
MLRLLCLGIALVGALSEAVFEDSAALSSIWEATSTGSTDRLIDIIIQNREFAHHRAADGRGPMFWAFEFKNVDAYALLKHLEVKEDTDDLDGKAPRSFFDGTDADFAEFSADAEAKVESLAALLAQREEEFYSYQEDVTDDEEYAASDADQDEIDYADDDEDELEEDVEEDASAAAERKRRLQKMKDEM